MKQAAPVALFTTYEKLKEFDIRDYPDLEDLLGDGERWRQNAWNWAREFLLDIGKNKSVHTYSRFRSELEKFLLWTILVNNKPIISLKRADILTYIEFTWQPPLNWICLVNVEKYKCINGHFKTNKHWAPFSMLAPKETGLTKLNKRKYRPSQQSLHATFTALNAFYNYLVDKEHAILNPIKAAKKDCKLIKKDAQEKVVNRLTKEQWSFMLLTAKKMAAEDAQFERNLFLIAAIKALFLNISELSERPDWSPSMGHFWQDFDQTWWFKAFGKGRKIRDITVPDSFIPYLKRYRVSRGLDALPRICENEPVIKKLRGRGSMTARHLSRLVQQVFDRACEEITLRSGKTAGRQFKEATTQWLRHTGASLEIERGRPLKDVSEDLGHSSIATTDRVYIQTKSNLRANEKRANSGKSRKV